MTKIQLSEFLKQFQPNCASMCLSGVASDSRQDLNGKLFVALKGQKVDGHAFVEQAAHNGAAACLVRKDYVNKSVKIPLIAVDDPLETLQEMAKWQVTHTKAKIIAVTGSVGKTTTKDFLYTILKSKYKTAATSGNQNSQVGLAVSLLNNIEGDEECIVVEMGMTSPHEIEKLVQIAPPTIAIVTHVALVHACNFEDLEAIARAKAEIFSSPETKVSIINYDSPYAALLLRLARGKKITYSVQSLLATVKLQVEDTFLRLFEMGRKTELPFVSLPAPHVYSNALAAITAAKECGMTYEEIGRALKQLTLPAGRLQIVEKHGITFVNDAYNASEVSTKASLSYMQKKHVTGRKIAVIGQMRELGRFSKECHARVGEHALDCVEKLFCLGEECEPIIDVWQDKDRHIAWHKEFDELMHALKNELRAGDLVLLKGSRSNGLDRILEAF